MPCSGPREPFSARSRSSASASSRARGIEHHDRVEARPRLVVGLDAREVRLDQPARRHAPGGHRRLQIDDRLLVHLEKLDHRRRLRARRRASASALRATARITARKRASTQAPREHETIPHVRDCKVLTRRAPGVSIPASGGCHYFVTHPERCIGCDRYGGSGRGDLLDRHRRLRRRRRVPRASPASRT